MTSLDFIFTGQITAEESLFFYSDGTTTSDYSNPDFMPTFKSDIVPNDDISTHCQGNTECIFDYVVSGNPDVATATLQANVIYTELENQACK